MQERREGGTQAGCFVGGERVLGERKVRRMINRAGDAGPDAFGRAEHDRTAQRRAIKSAAMQCRMQCPEFERQAIFGAAQQAAIGVGMAIDQPRH